MSYALPAQLRQYLDQDTTTLDSTFQALLDRARSALDLALGFSFADVATTPSITRRTQVEGDDTYFTVPLDSMFENPYGISPAGRLTNLVGNEWLYLPAPGATSITSVTESATLLDPSLYELEPVFGKALLRLDPNGNVAYWQRGRRNIVVVYTLRPAPAALVQCELAEAVRLWRAKAAGFSDVVGVAGSTEMRYSKALLATTVQVIQDLQKHYGDVGMAGG